MSSYSVHLQYLTKHIRNLPFSDMVRLAEDLRVEIQKRKQDDLDAYIVAHALINACSTESELSELTQNEERVFKSVFARKRQITVVRDGSHWKVELPSMTGTQVIGTELRATIGQMLDAAATVHILTRK